MADPQTRKLARQIVDIDRRLKGVERTPQLAHSSIDDGFLPVYDKDGNLTAKFGRQDDGTWGAPPLSGPVPSMPVGVTALGGPGMLSVSWTGEYESKAAPLDFDTLEILVDGVLAGAIPNRDGGTVSISAEEGTRYISARIRTLVPRHSSTTSPFGVEVGPPADQLFVEARERIEDAEVSLGETQVRLEGAEQAVTEVRDGLDTLETVTLPSAVADLEAADSALWDARDALESDIDAVRSSANGKNTVHWSTSTLPNEYDGVVDDTWFRMSSMGSGGRVVSQWRWNGVVWVSTVVDNAMIANLDAGKITSGFIDAERFKGGSISASSIAVGDFSNLATIDPIRDVNVSRPSNWATETVDGYITPKASSQNYLM